MVTDKYLFHGKEDKEATLVDCFREKEDKVAILLNSFHGKEDEVATLVDCFREKEDKEATNKYLFCGKED